MQPDAIQRLWSHDPLVALDYLLVRALHDRPALFVAFLRGGIDGLLERLDGDYTLFADLYTSALRLCEAFGVPQGTERALWRWLRVVSFDDLLGFENPAWPKTAAYPPVQSLECAACAAYDDLLQHLVGVMRERGLRRNIHQRVVEARWRARTHAAASPWVEWDHMRFRLVRPAGEYLWRAEVVETGIPPYRTHPLYWPTRASRWKAHPVIAQDTLGGARFEARGLSHVEQRTLTYYCEVRLIAPAFDERLVEVRGGRVDASGQSVESSKVIDAFRVFTDVARAVRDL